jgi:maltose-binding protein MalE
MRYTAAMRKRWSWSVLMMVLTACSLTPPGSNTPTAAPTAASTPTPAIAPTPTPALTPNTLVVWLPPQFGTDPNTLGEAMLQQQLAEFGETVGLTVTARAKAEGGRGGILESLLAAYNVAPGALPDVVALRPDDLAAASAVGAVIPLEGWVARETLEEAYPFAQVMSRIEGRWVGVPFAADARVAVYNTQVYTSALTRWSNVVTGTLVIPGAEANALTVLNDYLALDGPLADANGEPLLSVPLLTSIFTQLKDAQQARWLPTFTLTLTDTAATWRVYRERRATFALTSARAYFSEAGRVQNTAAGLPPTLDGSAFTLAEGWCWALVNTGRDYTPAAELLNWLTATTQLGQWTRAARVLPPRSAVLAMWGDDPQAPLAAALLTSAQLQPPAAVLDKLGPLLQTALEDVLNDRAAPNEAANTVAQAYREP